MAAPKTVLRFSAATLEQVCRALGAAVRREQVPSLVAVLKVSEKAGAASNAKWERLFSSVWEAQARQDDGRPLLRLVSEVMDCVRTESPEDFEAHRLAINDRLVPSGYRVRIDGKVARDLRVSTPVDVSPRSTEPVAEEEAPRVSWWSVAGALLDAYHSLPHREAARSYERGDKFFKCEIEDGESTQTLERIEAEGWRLENASYQERGGSQVGLYLFRRV